MQPTLTIAAAAALGAALLAPASAHALTLEAGAHLAQDPTATQLGEGVEARVGFGLPTPGVHLSPELGLAYTRFDQTSYVRGLAGGSLTVGKTLRPGVYAHLGYARDLAAATGGATWDGGALIDLAAIPLVTFGLRAGYTALPDAGGSLGASLNVAIGF